MIGYVDKVRSHLEVCVSEFNNRVKNCEMV